MSLNFNFSLCLSRPSHHSSEHSRSCGFVSVLTSEKFHSLTWVFDGNLFEYPAICLLMYSINFLTPEISTSLSSSDDDNESVERSGSPSEVEFDEHHHYEPHRAWVTEVGRIGSSITLRSSGWRAKWTNNGEKCSTFLSSNKTISFFPFFPFHTTNAVFFSLHNNNTNAIKHEKLKCLVLITSKEDRAGWDICVEAGRVRAWRKWEIRHDTSCDVGSRRWALQTNYIKPSNHMKTHTKMCCNQLWIFRLLRWRHSVKSINTISQVPESSSIIPKVEVFVSLTRNFPPSPAYRLIFHIYQNNPRIRNHLEP